MLLNTQPLSLFHVGSFGAIGARWQAIWGALWGALIRAWPYLSAAMLPVLFFAYRWFLLKTDVMVGYNWTCLGAAGSHPNFDIRNRSSSRTYVLGNVKYTRNNGKEIVTLDNKSLWGRELKPGTILHVEVAPVPSINSFQQCIEVGVSVRLQNEREFKGQGPGYLYKGFRKLAFALRQRMERASLPLG